VRLSNLNPTIQIESFETQLTSANALEPVQKISTSSWTARTNFPTRYLVNDACILLGKPNVYRLDLPIRRQVTVFGCLTDRANRCLYPEPASPGLVPSCAEGGVLGVLPGIVGRFKRWNLKLILDTGENLAGRLPAFDAPGNEVP